MTNSGVYFNEHQVKELAVYVLELCKLGAAYKIEEHQTGWKVYITGF